jgi:hypothetical protein
LETLASFNVAALRETLTSGVIVFVTRGCIEAVKSLAKGWGSASIYGFSLR